MMNAARILPEDSSIQTKDDYRGIIISQSSSFRVNFRPSFVEVLLSPCEKFTTISWI